MCRVVCMKGLYEMKVHLGKHIGGGLTSHDNLISLKGVMITNNYSPHKLSSVRVGELSLIINLEY